MNSIILTPINLDKPSTDNGKKAKIDYLREREHSSSFDLPIAKWDDSKYGKAEIGNYFGFVHQTRNIVEIFRIERIILAEHRPDYWDIPEHRSRNILVFSAQLGEVAWTTYKQNNNYKENFILRGTTKCRFEL